MTPRYPIYVPSKGRYTKTTALTARFLTKERVPFSLVVEEPEEPFYRAAFPKAEILVLPFANLGLGSIPARNWIKAHATELGAERHWQLDDNIRGIRRMYRTRRIPCAAGPAFAAAEDFVDRYENVGVAGLNYQMFVTPGYPPFMVNVKVYSAVLVANALPYRWRGRYNEDADLCLQVLAGGLTTLLINAFMIDKMRTMTMTGGNAAELYAGDGRLKMARSLERAWPHVVTTERRWQRPQHVVRANWRKFDTPLRLKPGIDLDALAPNEYGLELREVRPVTHPTLRRTMGLD